MVRGVYSVVGPVMASVCQTVQLIGVRPLSLR
jgi:hypothetical protein